MYVCVSPLSVISESHNFNILVTPCFFLSAEKYICYAEQTHAVLQKLSKNGKKMFLITNSPFDFV